jgi:adenylate cyclase
MAAIALSVPYYFSGTPVPDEQRLTAIGWAKLGARLGAEDALALARSAQILGLTAQEYEEADAMIEHAAILNPNHAVVWFAGGFVSINCGDGERALERFNRVLRLSPLDHLRANVWYGSAFAYNALGRHREGYAMATKAVQTWPHVHSLGALITNAVPLGHLAEAREALRRLLQLQPNFKLAHVSEVFHTRDLHLRGNFLDAFRQAGLE